MWEHLGAWKARWGGRVTEEMNAVEGRENKEEEASKVVCVSGKSSLGLFYRCSHRATGSYSCTQEDSCRLRVIL